MLENRPVKFTILRVKEKNDNFNGYRKVFENIQPLFRIKTPSQLERENNILWLRKTIHEKPMANFILNGEMLNTVPLKPRLRQRCLLSGFLCTMALKVLVSAIKIIF